VLRNEDIITCRVTTQTTRHVAILNYEICTQTLPSVQHSRTNVNDKYDLFYPHCNYCIDNIHELAKTYDTQQHGSALLD